jgi:hypothetical protein
MPPAFDFDYAVLNSLRTVEPDCMRRSWAHETDMRLAYPGCTFIYANKRSAERAMCGEALTPLYDWQVTRNLDGCTWQPTCLWS